VAQSPVTTNITYLFDEWNGYTSGGTNAISLNMPASSQTMNANYVSSFRVIVLPSIYCTGISVTSSPTGTNSNGSNGGLDAFYSAGTTTFTANAGSSGLNFVGWAQDLSGSTSPYPFSLQGELIGTANYNVPTTTVPLTVTSISPATPTVTNGATTLTVTGTGFTTNGAVTFGYFGEAGSNFAPRNVTLQSTTQLQIQLNAGDLASVGYSQILILNVTAGLCNPEGVFTFPVANSAGAPAFTISKSHLGDFSPGEQGAHYTILVTNSGTGTISEPVTVTENVPSGETLVSMSGSGWNCSTLPTCTTSSTLAAGMSYGAITVTVNVRAGATSPQVNSATVSGGSAEAATATDSTTIVSTVSVPNVTGDTQSAAETAITNAGLTVGSVTMQISNTVPAGEVISSSPSGGTMVAPGTAVNIVISTGTTATPCDVNQDGSYTVADVQAMINEALGKAQAVNDLNSDHVVNAVDIQIVINAALNLGCTV
jgi:hypothetical protein